MGPFVFIGSGSCLGLDKVANAFWWKKLIPMAAYALVEEVVWNFLKILFTAAILL